MEFCKHNLRELIYRKQQFSRYDLAYFVHLFIKGLYVLETEKHIYHRDIRPETIMIGDDNEFKLISFKIIEKNKPGSINEDIGMHFLEGEVEYSSPELYQCMQTWIYRYSCQYECSLEKNDVYSLGLVILEMCSFEAVVKFRRDNELYHKKMEEQINQIQIPWLCNLLQKMLTNDWHVRPRFKELLKIIEEDEEFINDFKEYNNKKEGI